MTRVKRKIMTAAASDAAAGEGESTFPPKSSWDKAAASVPYWHAFGSHPFSRDSLLFLVGIPSSVPVESAGRIQESLTFYADISTRTLSTSR